MNPIATMPSALRERASRYRAMARLISDDRTITALLVLATEYEVMADQLERVEQGESPQTAGEINPSRE